MKSPQYGFRVVWSIEDKEYIALVPEFPGLSAFGETPDDAIREAQVALSLFVEDYVEEGQALPEPEYLIEHSGQFRLRIPHTLHWRLVQRAADEGVSLNAYASSLLASGLGDAEARTEIRRSLDEVLRELRAAAGSGTLTKRDSSERMAAPKVSAARRVAAVTKRHPKSK